MPNGSHPPIAPNAVSGRSSVPNQLKQSNQPKYCSEHPDELVNYFCFDTSEANICAECVIHGNYKNHEVMTIKKAYPHICSRLEDLKGGVSDKVEELITTQKKLDQGRWWCNHDIITYFYDHY